MADIERLDKWAEAIRNVADPDFNLETWDHCAAGHLCKEEFAIKAGLRQVNGYEPTYGPHIAGFAVAEFFGITRDQAHDIISPGIYPIGEVHGAKGRAHCIARITALADYYRNTPNVAPPTYERNAEYASPFMRVFVQLLSNEPAVFENA